jgi:TolB-like protein/Tfp pilus assembly protein PilF
VGSLFTELKRRKVVRVAVVYAATAFVILQAADIMLPRLGVPEWAMSLIVILVVLGFPVAIVLAWALELTPDGVRVTPSTVQSHPAEPTPSLLGKRTMLVAGVLVVLGIGLGAGWFLRPITTPGVREASIAVLPFMDMSAEGDQQYFGDGLSEEILNLLAGISELKVSGRTSSFSFKGTNVSIPEIGRTLGVAHVLEGSVRRSGDQLRITAQLVEAETGFHLWSETYNRRMADVFAIQDEIAGAIADALRLTLVASAHETADLEAYDLYLRARTLIYGRSVEGLNEARRLIDRALALDPDYPPALAVSGELWMLLSDAPSSYGDIPEGEAHAAARAVLHRALALDPELADAHAAMGLLFMTLGDYAVSRAHLERALTINPSHTNANHWHRLGLSRSGRLREAVDAGYRFAERDPLFLTTHSSMIAELTRLGRFDEAERLGRQLMRSHPERQQVPTVFAGSLESTGRQAEAAELIEQARSLGDRGALVALYSEQIYFRLGEYARAAEISTGWLEAEAWIAQGREEEGLARVRARMEASPGNFAPLWGLLHGLSLAGLHEELLDFVSERWVGAEELNGEFPFDFSGGNALAPLAAAQRATGRHADLAATLAYWSGVLDFLEENGLVFGEFAFVKASFHALSSKRDRALERLGEAIALGYRNPLLGRHPAFEPWWNDAEFRALVERNLALINDERAKLGLEPL